MTEQLIQPYDYDRVHGQEGLVYVGSQLNLDRHNTQFARDYLRGVMDQPIPSAEKALQQEIISRGTLYGMEIGLDDTKRDGYGVMADRIWMGKVHKTNPAVAETIAEKGVAGFHVTNSYALAGLVESGSLVSARMLEEQGRASYSGAHDTAESLEAVSFGNLSYLGENWHTWGTGNRTLTDTQVKDELQQDIAAATELMAEHAPGTRGYMIAERGRHNVQKALDEYQRDPQSLASVMMRFQFPVAIGINREFVRQKEAERTSGSILRGVSAYGEFRPNSSEIPIGALPVIVVPQDKVAAVTKLLEHFNHANVSVVPAEDLVAT